MLMIPATMFEKFFSRWLVFTFGFLIVFLIAFKLADWTRVTVYMISYPGVERYNCFYSTFLIWWEKDNSGRFSMTCNYLHVGSKCLLFAQSLFVLGSVHLAKRIHL